MNDQTNTFAHGSSTGPAIRPMIRAEVDLAVEWAAAEGWNPGLFDADAFYAADPDGFLIERLGDEPVAVISAVRYGETFGFLGFYIVRPQYRGQGHGWRIWQAAMARLSGRNIGLDGVIAQQGNYQRCGFRLAYRNVRYQGAGASVAFDSIRAADVGLVPLSSLPFEQVAAYDRSFFPAEREVFLRRWIAPPQGVALGLVRDARMVGYGVLRACRNGHKIGPLFADSPEWAEILFNALLSRSAHGAPVFLDVPECNPAAVALAERNGMHMVFETARMYTGPAPDVATDRTYGVTTFELG